MSETVAQPASRRTNPCRHIFPSGLQCGSPALRGEKLCFFHTTARRPAPHRTEYGTTLLSFPEPEDLHAVQRALGELLRLLAARQLDAREAAPILRTLSLASANLARMDRQHHRQQARKLDRQQARVDAHPDLAPALTPVETVILDPILGPIAPGTDPAPASDPASPESAGQAELLLAHPPEIVAPETLPDPIHTATVAGDLPAEPVALFHFAKQELVRFDCELARRAAAGEPPPLEPILSTGLALDPILLYTYALDGYDTHLRGLGLNPDRLEPGEQPFPAEPTHSPRIEPAGTVLPCAYAQQNQDFSTLDQIA